MSLTWEQCPWACRGPGSRCQFPAVSRIIVRLGHGAKLFTSWFSLVKTENFSFSVYVFKRPTHFFEGLSGYPSDIPVRGKTTSFHAAHTSPSPKSPDTPCFSTEVLSGRKVMFMGQVQRACVSFPEFTWWLCPMWWRTPFS